MYLKNYIIIKYTLFLSLVFFTLISHAQLGFCTGNSGDPIFLETFGEGSKFGKLPVGSSSGYKYKYGTPENGYYSISASTSSSMGWFNIPDHTQNDNKGRMLIVNAAARPGEFFEIAVSGLCENTSYEFSSWLINLLPSNHECARIGKEIPINVKFEIWDSTDTILLKSGDTGSIYSSITPNWQQYGLVFQTKPNQTSVILKMRNNGRGGCGNDLAIDDIMFRTCGDTVIIEDSSENAKNAFVYEDELPYSATLTATPDSSIFSTHFYQWQESTDGENWVNIVGEDRNSFLVTGVNSNAFYRVLVAEGVSNLLNSLCNSTSEIFKVSILPGENPDKPPRKKIPTLKKIIRPLKEIGLTNIDKTIKPLVMVKIKASDKLPKTRKRIIIVKEGFKVIYNKVWIDGAIGKFVKTGEEIISKGAIKGGFIIEETIYNKAKYGYNSIKRTYTIKAIDSYVLQLP